MVRFNGSFNAAHGSDVVRFNGGFNAKHSIRGSFNADASAVGRRAEPDLREGGCRVRQEHGNKQ